MYSSKYSKLSQHTKKQTDKFYLQKQPIMDKKGKIETATIGCVCKSKNI